MPEVYNSAVEGDEKSLSKTSDYGHKKTRDVTEYSEVLRHESSSKSALCSFAVRPKGITLSILDEHEEILLLLRAAVVTQIPWILLAVLMMFLPMLFPLFPPFEQLPAQFRLITTLYWYLMVSAYVLQQFLGWYFNVFIVTDERVIDVDFRSLVYKNISATKIEQVEDVSATTSGAIPSLFGFGTVTLQTAGAVPEFEIRNVPNPSKVSKFIHEMMLEEENEKIEGRVR